MVIDNGVVIGIAFEHLKIQIAVRRQKRDLISVQFVIVHLFCKVCFKLFFALCCSSLCS